MNPEGVAGRREEEDSMVTSWKRIIACERIRFPAYSSPPPTSHHLNLSSWWLGGGGGGGHAWQSLFFGLMARRVKEVHSQAIHFPTVESLHSPSRLLHLKDLTK